MDSHHLRHFVAVGEELHFGRAAARLGIAQPPLSQSIKRLEGSLGIQLFVRNRRHVSLTPGGLVLLDEARRILNQIDLAERLTRRAANSGVSRLRIGFTPIAMFTELPHVLTEFRNRWPLVRIHLEERPTQPQAEALAAGSQDVGILFRPVSGLEGLATRLIERVRSVAAVPSVHPLAKKKRIRVADMTGQPFISLHPRVNPEAHAAINAACRAAGFVPSIVQYANQTYTILSLVANELGLAIVGSNARHMKIAGVTLVPLVDHPPDLEQELVLAWTPAAESPVLRSFVGLFEKMSEDNAAGR
ncbi:MAG TPA: LysR substrate-binding domain-containing protein [Burkholderiales bacterium]|nr:LysR substrate-binding domain-containing protein [Burkholderiales bacterium]